MPVKVKLVNVEDGIISNGFRKMAAFVERLNEDTHTYFVSTQDTRSISTKLLTRYDSTQLGTEEIDEIAENLADADLVGFSSMTAYSDLTRAIITRLKEKSAKPYVVWGGIHPIVDPEDAIRSSADAVCTGEGELAFQEFYELFKSGQDHRHVQNFWFRHDGETVRNCHRPLMTPQEMSDLPYPSYGEHERLYKKGKGFGPPALRDYLASNGLAYNTLWTIGCPYRCTYCGNSKFLANDPKYRKIRHPDPKYVIGEVKQAIARHPHISSVIFNDDNLLFLNNEVLWEFSQSWHDEVGIPFCVLGVFPNAVDAKKLELLTWAGMNRVRMGIQSGSKRILDFYRRPTSIEKVEQAARIISGFRKYHVAPGYDIIIDNPIETRQDVVDTLELVYRLARPFSLNLYSLKVIPNTELERQIREVSGGIDIDSIKVNFDRHDPTLANVLLYVLQVIRPPRWLFDRLLARALPRTVPQPRYPVLYYVARTLWGVKRGLSYLRLMDFSTILGSSGYWTWRLGIIDFWHRYLNAKPPEPALEGDWPVGLKRPAPRSDREVLAEAS